MAGDGSLVIKFGTVMQLEFDEKNAPIHSCIKIKIPQKHTQ